MFKSPVTEGTHLLGNCKLIAGASKKVGPCAARGGVRKLQKCLHVQLGVSRQLEALGHDPLVLILTSLLFSRPQLGAHSCSEAPWQTE